MKLKFNPILPGLFFVREPRGVGGLFASLPHYPNAWNRLLGHLMYDFKMSKIGKDN